jgi:hypothetical protein
MLKRYILCMRASLAEALRDAQTHSGYSVIANEVGLQGGPAFIAVSSEHSLRHSVHFQLLYSTNSALEHDNYKQTYLMSEQGDGTRGACWQCVSAFGH